MSRIARSTGRLLATLAGAAALSIAVAGTASAFHCYKEDWNDAAYAHLSQGGTPWLPLSDLGEIVVATEIGLPQCTYVVDGVVADFMTAKGLTEEPLIHTRATAGGGAAHQGKDVPPFNYLTDADFVLLDSLLGPAIEDCLSA
jgi:hypothetical protein